MTRRVSALFIDFDNVYVSLRNRDPRAAVEFQRNPRGWLRDLERLDIEEIDTDGEASGDASDDATTRKRSFIIRRSYANPDTLKDARPFWTRGGFEVIDCPSLTQTGKNSADIYMVMDILDTLKDYPHVEEFVILSADADFTPVITRLRKFLKHTVIYANQVTAGAYRSAADSMIDEDDFIDLLRPASAATAATPAPLAAVALPGAAQPDHATARTAPAQPQAAPQQPARARAPGNGNAPWWRRNAGARPGGGAPEGQGARASRADLAAIVRDLVAEEGDAPLAKIANVLKFKAGSDWAGAGSFLALMRDLDIAPFKVDEATGQVRRPEAAGDAEAAADAPPATGDATPHAAEPPLPDGPPAAAALAAGRTEPRAAAASEPPSPALVALMNRITGVTALPPLSAGTFEALFAAVPEAINPNTIGDMVRLSRAVAMRVERAGFPVSDRQAGFVLRGLQFQKHAFSADDAPAQLAAKFRRQVLFLARNAGLTLDDTDLSLLGDWVRAADEPLSGIIDEPTAPALAAADAEADDNGAPEAAEQDDLPIAFDDPVAEALEPPAAPPQGAPGAGGDEPTPPEASPESPAEQSADMAPAWQEEAQQQPAAPEMASDALNPAVGDPFDTEPVDLVKPVEAPAEAAPLMPVAPEAPAAESLAPELTALAAALAELDMAAAPLPEARGIDELPPATPAVAETPVAGPDAFDAIAMSATDLPVVEAVADPMALTPAVTSPVVDATAGAPEVPEPAALPPALAALPPLPEPEAQPVPAAATPALPPVASELPAFDFDLDDPPAAPSAPAEAPPLREIDLPLAELLADIEAEPVPAAAVPEVALSLDDLLAEPERTAAPGIPAIVPPVAAPAPSAEAPPIELALEDLLRDEAAGQPAAPPAAAAEPPPIELALDDLIRDPVAPLPAEPTLAPPVPPVEPPPPAAEPAAKGRSFNAIFERLYAEKLQRMKGGDGSSGAG